MVAIHACQVQNMQQNTGMSCRKAERRAYSEGSGRGLLPFKGRLVRAVTIHAFQVQGSTLQCVRVPQKPWLDPPHQHWLADMAELLLEDPARQQTTRLRALQWC